MKPLRVLAIDDEALALRRVEMAMREMEDAELVGMARGGRDGQRLALALKPDVLLLDINMPGVDGFDVVEGLEADQLPLLIFVTAYNEHAIRAFDVSAVDYLLKPLEFDRLKQALQRAQRTLRMRDADDRAAELNALVTALRSMRSAQSTPRYESEFWVPKGAGFERVRVDAIDWIEAERDYVHLHAEGKSWLLRETMARMQDRLDPEIFTRVHRSALVRKERIALIERAGYGKLRLRLTTGAQVPVGSTFLKDIRGLLHGAAAS